MVNLDVQCDALLVGSLLVEWYRGINCINGLGAVPYCALTSHSLHKLLRFADRLAQRGNLLAYLSAQARGCFGNRLLKRSILW